MATQREIWKAIEDGRSSPDGKAAVQMAAKLFDAKDMERCAEARQWIKAGIALDQARGNKLLEELKTRSDKRKQRSALQEGAGKRPMKVIDGGAT
jgi:hypothetical protein